MRTTNLRIVCSADTINDVKREQLVAMAISWSMRSRGGVMPGEGAETGEEEEIPTHQGQDTKYAARQET